MWKLLAAVIHIKDIKFENMGCAKEENEEGVDGTTNSAVQASGNEDGRDGCKLIGTHFLSVMCFAVVVVVVVAMVVVMVAGCVVTMSMLRKVDEGISESKTIRSAFVHWCCASRLLVCMIATQCQYIRYCRYNHWWSLLLL